MSTTTTGSKPKIMPISPIAKPPVAINTSSRIGDVEDDFDTNKPKDKQNVINPQPAATTSPTREKDQKQSQDKSPRKQEPSSSPKKGEGQTQSKPTTQAGQHGNLSKSAMEVHVEGSENVYNPYEDIKHGASEEWVILKSEVVICLLGKLWPG